MKKEERETKKNDRSGEDNTEPAGTKRIILMAVAPSKSETGRSYR